MSETVYNMYVTEMEHAGDYHFTTLYSKTAHNSQSINPTLTWLMSLKSWLTSIIPPLKELMASASASMVSISRWLVGSSSNRRWGLRNASHANITRHLCPSDKFLIAQIWYVVCKELVYVVTSWQPTSGFCTLPQMQHKVSCPLTERETEIVLNCS